MLTFEAARKEAEKKVAEHTGMAEERLAQFKSGLITPSELANGLILDAHEIKSQCESIGGMAISWQVTK